MIIADFKLSVCSTHLIGKYKCTTTFFIYYGLFNLRMQWCINHYLPVVSGLWTAWLRGWVNSVCVRLVSMATLPGIPWMSSCPHLTSVGYRRQEMRYSNRRSEFGCLKFMCSIAKRVQKINNESNSVFTVVNFFYRKYFNHPNLRYKYLHSLIVQHISFWSPFGRKHIKRFVY